MRRYHPVLSKGFEQKVESVKDLVLSEVNVKEIRFLRDGENSIIRKSAKPNFKMLGPKVGASMKEVSARIQSMNADEIKSFETTGEFKIKAGDSTFTLTDNELEIITKDVEGWQVEVNGNVTVALDLKISEDLKLEGLARELVNKIQNMRKDAGFEVNDRINVKYKHHVDIQKTLNIYKGYICNEILADDIKEVENLAGEEVELNTITTIISINKVI